MFFNSRTVESKLHYGDWLNTGKYRFNLCGIYLVLQVEKTRVVERFFIHKGNKEFVENQYTWENAEVSDLEILKDWIPIRKEVEDDEDD